MGEALAQAVRQLEDEAKAAAIAASKPPVAVSAAVAESAPSSSTVSSVVQEIVVVRDMAPGLPVSPTYAAGAQALPGAQVSLEHQLLEGSVAVADQSEVAHREARPSAGEASTPVGAPTRPDAMSRGHVAQLCDVLLRLLAELRQDPELTAGVDEVEGDVTAALTSEKVPAVIEKVGGMLLQRIRHLEKARHALTLLLDQMMGQLDSLNAYIKGNSEEETRRMRSSDALNLQISGEVQAMGETVSNGNDLALLRRQLSERMQSISRHLQSFRDREQEHARQSRERAARMSARMEQMEGETRALQARLSDEQRQALLDALTRIPNRLAWEQRIVAEMARWERFRQPTCVLAWDIDGFKGINDRYGHRAGDKVLVVVAESLAGGIRGTDFVARYGGEEFVMLLPGTSLENGVAIANQMREAIAQTGFHFRGAPVSVTISCGITELQEGDTSDEVFDRADRAMYQAKDGGRNRVVSG
jgi:diguanylate cyclase